MRPESCWVPERGPQFLVDRATNAFDRGPFWHLIVRNANCHSERALIACAMHLDYSSHEAEPLFWTLAYWSRTAPPLHALFQSSCIRPTTDQSSFEEEVVRTHFTFVGTGYFLALQCPRRYAVIRVPWLWPKKFRRLNKASSATLIKSTFLSLSMTDSISTVEFQWGGITLSGEEPSCWASCKGKLSPGIRLSQMSRRLQKGLGNSDYHCKFSKGCYTALFIAGWQCFQVFSRTPTAALQNDRSNPTRDPVQSSFSKASTSFPKLQN